MSTARPSCELCPACGHLNHFRPEDVRWHKKCWARLSEGLDAAMTQLKAYQNYYEDEDVVKAIVALHARVRQIELRQKR